MSDDKVLRLTTYGKGGYSGTVGRIHKAIAQGQPFKTGGAFKATTGPAWHWGRLDYDYRESVKQADYVVWSYSTPIAWHKPGDRGGYWVMPEDKYSATTTHHQNITRGALVLADVRTPEVEYDNV